MWNPYATLKEHSDIHLFVKPLPKKVRGLFSVKGSETVIVLNELDPTTVRRCTLAHELGHYFLGHRGNFLETTNHFNKLTLGRQEHAATCWAVDRLIDTHEFLTIAKQDHQLTVDDICEHFWVTQDVLFFKLNRLANMQASGVFLLPGVT